MSAYTSATAAAAGAALAANGAGTSELLTWATGLALAAVAVAVVDIFTVSGGLLLIASGGLAVASIIVAFQAGSATGLLFLIVLPIIGWLILRTGIRVIMRSPAVPQRVIADDAGYGQTAVAAGVAIGSTGVLVTAARPTGRARFAGGEIDVQVHGSPLDRGAAVRVSAIDGPMVLVVPAT